ncbi:hypothetical protein CPLU01_15495, partial [Colletotrichum plurivorum]
MSAAAILPDLLSNTSEEYQRTESEGLLSLTLSVPILPSPYRVVVADSSSGLVAGSLAQEACENSYADRRSASAATRLVIASPNKPSRECAANEGGYDVHRGENLFMARVDEENDLDKKRDNYDDPLKQSGCRNIPSCRVPGPRPGGNARKEWEPGSYAQPGSLPLKNLN